MKIKYLASIVSMILVVPAAGYAIERKINDVYISRIRTVSVSGPYSSGDNILGIAPQRATGISATYEVNGQRAKVILCSAYNCITIRGKHEGTKIIADRLLALPSEIVAGGRYVIELDGNIVGQKCNNPVVNGIVTETDYVSRTTKETCVQFSYSVGEYDYSE